jgi:hypothetical protein
MAEPTATVPGPIPYGYWKSPTPEFLAIFKAAVMPPGVPPGKWAYNPISVAIQAAPPTPQPGPPLGYIFLCVANQAAKQRVVKVYIRQLPQGEGRPPMPVVIEMIDVDPQ